MGFVAPQPMAQHKKSFCAAFFKKRLLSSSRRARPAPPSPPPGRWPGRLAADSRRSAPPSPAFRLPRTPPDGGAASSARPVLAPDPPGVEMARARPTGATRRNGRDLMRPTREDAVASMARFLNQADATGDSPPACADGWTGICAPPPPNGRSAPRHSDRGAGRREFCPAITRDHLPRPRRQSIDRAALDPVFGDHHFARNRHITA